MPWTTLGTVAPGDVLRAASGTAAYNNIIGNLYMGQPNFTTAAARDAAITAPEEGMTAYLTAPAAATVTATGATTAIPTGITTVYNGTVWVCTTPVGAYSTATGTTTSTSFVTTLTGDATAISVTIPTGTTALLMFQQEVGCTSATEVHLTFAVSGATTIAASNANGVEMYVPTTARRFHGSRVYVFSGLTAGVNTFTLNYKTILGTATYHNRQLTVAGVA